MGVPEIRAKLPEKCGNMPDGKLAADVVRLSEEICAPLAKAPIGTPE